MEQSKGKTRKEAEGKRKCEKIVRETFGKKNYITKNKVGEVINMFKARVGMSEFAEVAGPENAAIQNLAAQSCQQLSMFCIPTSNVITPTLFPTGSEN